LLRALASREGDFALLFDVLPWGAANYRATDCFAPVGALDQLRRYDAIYFGTFGDTTIPDDVVRWCWWIPVSRALDHYANIRPIRMLHGIRGPLQDCKACHIDWVLVRDNGGQEFTSDSRLVRRASRGIGDPAFVRAFQIMRVALEVAHSRPRRRLSIVTGSRTEPAEHLIWERASAATRNDFPEVAIDAEPIHTVLSRMTQRPESLDTIIAIGSHANVVANLGTSFAGGHVHLPSANLDPSRRCPASFGPVHGPAFDIAGRGIANPIGVLWSAVMMLEHLGEYNAALRLLRAIEHVIAGRSWLTPDLGGTATTREVANAVLAEL